MNLYARFFLCTNMAPINMLNLTVSGTFHMLKIKHDFMYTAKQGQNYMPQCFLGLVH